MKAINLFSHNEGTFKNIISAFDSGKNAICVQPTGTGKSFILLKLCQHYSDKKMLVIEPNRYITQTVSSKAKEYGIDNIEFMTYQKLIRMSKEETAAIQADIIALDEAHRIEAKQWNKAVLYLTETHSDSRMVLLTATPERTDGKNIKESFSGEIVCEKSLGDSIVEKILPAPIYISALYTFDEEIEKAKKKIDESINSEEKKELTKQLEAAKRKLELSHGVSEILKKHIKSKSGKYIVFCQNIEHLNTMQPIVGSWFNKAGFETRTYTVHSKMAGKDKEFLSFKNDNSDCIRLLFGINSFNEGVHLDDISGIIMLRPTQSNIIYLQQLGRALNAGTSNNPIVFDLVSNSSCSNTACLRSEIEGAIKRRDNDNDLINGEKEKEEFDLKDFHVFDYVQDVTDVIRLIENRCKGSFEFRLGQFLEYKEKYGTGYVEKKKAERFEGFYEWVLNIRRYYKRNQLNPERIKLLKDNEFIFSENEFRRDQLEGHIKAYIGEKKTNIIPQIYICDDGYRLGLTVCSAKNPNHYGNDIIKRYSINSISRQDVYDKAWFDNYLLVKKFVSENGIEKLNKNITYQDCNIGTWIQTQRKKYKNGTLSSERIKLLSDIGVVLNPHEATWNKFMNIIIECLKKNVKITQNTIFNNKKIGQQISTYKKRYKKGEVSEKRYLQLKALGIDLNKEGSLT